MRTRQIRRSLYPFLVQAREAGKKAVLRLDKLVMEDKVYMWDPLKEVPIDQSTGEALSVTPQKMVPTNSPPNTTTVQTASTKDSPTHSYGGTQSLGNSVPPMKSTWKNKKLQRSEDSPKTNCQEMEEEGPPL